MIKRIAKFVFFVLGCAGCGTTAAQQRCLETIGIAQLAVTAEQAIACSGDQKCIEDAALMRSLITVDEAKSCLQGSHD